MSVDLPEKQYRCLVAYLSFWPKLQEHFSLEKAFEDIGITLDKRTVISDLHVCGWDYTEETKEMKYWPDDDRDAIDA